MNRALHTLADRMGIETAYHGLTGARHDASDDTLVALLRAMRIDVADERDAARRLDEIGAEPGRRLAEWYVVPADAPDDPLPPDTDWSIETEAGDEIEGRGPLPPLPLGIHTLHALGEEATLLAAPPALPLPPRGWGLMVPLAGLDAAETGGIGTYEALGHVAATLAPLGARFLGLNPIHAGFRNDAVFVSPYTPSHRRRFNTMHVAAGAERAPGDGLIDFAAHLPRIEDAQRKAFAAFADAGGDPRFAAWRASEGESLRRFTRHQALADRHGAFWPDWPAELQDADRAATHPVSEAEMDFHAWLQWQAETQLTTAVEGASALRHGLYLDLAVGTHPAGAETWEDPALFAQGVSLGAPPDHFAPDGQSWTLAPFRPSELVARGFRPLAETLRAQLRFAGLLRIDHILGFSRAFWVPEETGVPGAYVRMPREAMLAVARIEAARAGAVLIGEDLGVIPAGLQARLRETGILGCRLAMFERQEQPALRYKAPDDYDDAALASFGTHDLPPWRGWRNGSDIRLRGRIKGTGEEALDAQLAHRAEEVAALDRAMAEAGIDPTDDDAIHAFLARSAARLVAVQAETVLDMDDQQNLPGTVAEHPNWRMRLDQDAGTLADMPRLRRVARIMQETGR